MKNTQLLVLSLFVLLFSNCKKDNNTEPSIDSLDEISQYGNIYGDKTSEVVIINSQGGPTIYMEDEMMEEMIQATGTENVLYFNVHQAQTQNPEKFTTSDITFEQAKSYDLESVANVKKVIDFFRTQKKEKIYVLGISFGAFVVQELIAQHGVEIADAFLIMVGRLDIEEVFWQDFSNGNNAFFEFDENGNSTIVSIGLGASFEERNMARLAAGLGFNRYTERMHHLPDLSKITYVYGNQDDRVGGLTPTELEFMHQKKINSVLVNQADHEKAIDAGLQLLKQTFNLP